MNHRDWKQNEVGSLKRVALVMRWLDERCEKVPWKHADKHHSYWWKHRVENEIGDYLCNGEFIAAAVLLGYELQWADDDPNPRFNMKRKRS